jgi:excisionase family DNA binding protein
MILASSWEIEDMHKQCAHCSHEGEQPAKKRAAKTVNSSKPAAGAGEHKSNSELLSRRAAAAYLGVSEITLAIWKSAGRYALPVIKVGRLVKYRRSDLEAFLERNTWDGGKRRGDVRGK